MPSFKCQYNGCRSTSKNNRLHRFPKDPERSLLWVQACNNPMLVGIPADILNNSYRVCNDHFQQWCYMNHADKKRLVHNALPDKIIQREGTKEQHMEKQQMLQKSSDMARETKRHVSDFNAKKRGLEARNEDVFILEVEPTLSHPNPISSDMANNILEETVEEYIPSTLSNSALPILDTVNHQKRKNCRESLLKNAGLQFLQEKHKSDQAIKMKELELQQRKLELEEKKLEMKKKKLKLEERRLEIENAERQTRLEMEMKKRQQRFMQAEKQQKLMECILQLLSKK